MSSLAEFLKEFVPRLEGLKMGTAMCGARPLRCLDLLAMSTSCKDDVGGVVVE
jgi:hypothetical protein